MNTIQADVAKFRTPAITGVQSQKGNALIEFAFVLPVFLILLFGMVTYSLAIYNKTVLMMAAREGARAGAVYDLNNFDPNDGSPDIGYITGQNSKACTVTRAVCANRLISFGNVTPNVSASLTGDILSVTASVNYTGIFFMTAGSNISSTSSMRLEAPQTSSSP